MTIDKDLDITGPGPHRLRISGNHASRVFVILPNRIVTLSGMTISDGLANGDSPFLPGAGGGILHGAPPTNFATSLTLSDVVLSGNQAVGNADAAKSPWLYPGLAVGGGEGQGGGLNSTAHATLIAINTTVARNHAQGGKGGAGGNGGNGAGGGLYDYDDSASPPAATKLILEGVIVTKNLALAGEAGAGGSNGQGIGGGVYYLGTFTFDPATVIEKNQAATGNDKIGPD